MDEQVIWKILNGSRFERHEFADILVSYLAALVDEKATKIEDFQTFVEDSEKH